MITVFRDSSSRHSNLADQHDQTQTGPTAENTRRQWSTKSQLEHSPQTHRLSILTLQSGRPNLSVYVSSERGLSLTLVPKRVPVVEV